MYRLFAIGVFWLALHAPALGQMSEQQIQREADLHRACIGADRNACHTVGEMYRDGDGVSRDYSRAFYYYTLACGAGLSGACMDLGGMNENGRGRPQNFAEAAVNYERACSLENPLGCSSLSLMYREGRGVPQDNARATAYYRLYCEYGGLCFN
jgi:uncharacterized protein